MRSDLDECPYIGTSDATFVMQCDLSKREVKANWRGHEGAARPLRAPRRAGGAGGVRGWALFTVCNNFKLHDWKPEPSCPHTREHSFYI